MPTSPVYRFVAAVALWSLTAACQALPADSPAARKDTNQRGGEVFNAVCADCHVKAAVRAPPLAMLHFMSAGAIYGALTTGAMKVQAAKLSDADKRAVAEYLSGKAVAGHEGTGAPPCGPTVKFDFAQPPVFAGWGIDIHNTRNMDTATSGLTRENLATLLNGAEKIRCVARPAKCESRIMLCTAPAVRPKASGLSEAGTVENTSTSAGALSTASEARPRGPAVPSPQ